MLDYDYDINSMLAVLTPEEKAELDSLLTPTLAGVELMPDDPCGWIERYFYIQETRAPIVLAPYQRQALQEALARYEDGDFVYNLMLWSDIKKSAKSTITAAVVLWRAYHIPKGSIKIIANDVKQADSRVAEYLRLAIALNPLMRQAVYQRRYFLQFPNGCKVEAIPIDPTGEAGGNDDMIVFSELWGANNLAAKKMWTESTVPPNKFGRAFRWVETYAGFEGESELLYNLYDGLVINGRQLENFEAPVYTNDSGQFALWNTRPRLAWQSEAYYRAERAAIGNESEFLRVHRNQWGSSTSKFVELEQWDNCRASIPDRQTNEPMVIAIDGAISNDCFAIIGVTRRATKYYVRFIRIWRPISGKPLNFYMPDELLKNYLAAVRRYDLPDGQRRQEALNILALDQSPESVIRGLALAGNVVKFAYDKFAIQHLISKMDGIAYFEIFDQNSKRLVADKMLQDLILSGQVNHDGNEALTEHIKNANSKVDGDRKIRIVKRSDSMKIDAAVCLSMACFAASEMRIE
jgi:hypothetical protein